VAVVVVVTDTVTGISTVETGELTSMMEYPVVTVVGTGDGVSVTTVWVFPGVSTVFVSVTGGRVISSV
jgi:hypothetical protein